MRKILAPAILILVLVLLGGTLVQAEEKKLNMGIMQWTCESLPSHVITTVLESRFGYKVKYEDMFEWGVSFAALGKGDIDLMLGEPAFVQFDYWTRSKDKLEIVSPIGFGLYQCLMVPAYVPINSIEELNEHKDKFGGKIVGIEAGAGLMQQTRDAIKEYSLDLSLVEGSTTAMVSALKSALDKNRWIVATSWTPTWWHQKYDLKFLKDPKIVYPQALVQYIMATKGFSQKHPVAAKALQSMYIPLDDILQMSAWVKEGSNVQDAAKRWCNENTEVIDRWVELANVQ